MEQKKQELIRPGYVRLKEAADYSAMTTRNLRILMNQGKVPFYRLGRRCVLFKLSELDRAFSKFRVSAAGES